MDTQHNDKYEENANKPLENLLKLHSDELYKKLKITQFTKHHLLKLKHLNKSPVLLTLPDSDAKKLLIHMKKKLPSFYDDSNYKALTELVEICDDSAIVASKMDIYTKSYFLFVKHGVVQQNSFDMGYIDTIKFDFITINNKEITFEGSFFCPAHIDENNSLLYLSIDQTELECDIVPRINHKYILGNLIAKQIGFKISISTNILTDSHIVNFLFKNNKTNHNVKKYLYTKQASLSSEFKNSYYYKNGWVIKHDKNHFIIKRDSCFLRYEIPFLTELLFYKENYARKAAFGRILYFTLKKLKKKKIWVFTDKADRADDNAECLLDYLNDIGIKNTKCYFSISKNAPDYVRLKNKFKIVSYLSFRHKMLLLLSDFTISGYINEEIYNPFFNYNQPYRDILQNINYIFLDHGVKKDDATKKLNRYRTNMKMMVCSGGPEYLDMLQEGYAYDDNQVVLTGLCRYDRLYNSVDKNVDKNDTRKIIAIMPTWRSYLMDGYNRKESKFFVKDNFTSTEYFKFYYDLLSSENLNLYLEKKGYQIHFVPHPTMFPYASFFDNIPNVKVWGTEVVHRDIYAMSSLLITDYSSIAFDFANLRKPLFYAQFDHEEYYGSQGHRSTSYFDFEKDGFGEVEYNLERIIHRIKHYVETDCMLADIYRERIDKFFMYNDMNCCKRTFEAMQRLENKLHDSN